MTKHFIIVWQDVPETTRIYRFDTDDAAWAHALRLCHGQYGGAVDLTDEQDEALTKLSNHLQTLVAIYDGDSSANPITVTGGDFEIIVTGWFM